MDIPSFMIIQWTRVGLNKLYNIFTTPVCDKDYFVPHCLHKYIALIFTFTLLSCDEEGSFLFSCANKLLQEINSPDSKYSAYVYERDCGATTELVTHVGLKLYGNETYFSEQARVLTFEGTNRLNISWRSNRELIIGHPRVWIYINKSVWNDVNITYTHIDFEERN